MKKQTKQFLPPLVRLALGAIAFSLLLLGSPAVNAQTIFTPFSADQIHTSGKRTVSGKVYASENAFRMETQMGGRSTISIIRMDRKVSWVLMPAQKMYMEMPWQGLAEVASTMKGATVQKDSLGSEQVGSFHCDKYRVHSTFNGKTYVTIEWAAKELNGFIVKKQDENGTWSTEFQNIHLGPQDPSLFEIPAGYQKMSMPNMPGMPAPQQ
ncbi:MAG: DUF4412 domain-containing protein [Candidatus Acidiferrum sp.]